MTADVPPSLQRFLDWLNVAQPVGGVEPMLIAYRAWLQSNGASEQEGAAAVAGILRFMKERHDPWAPIFDRIYASADPDYRTEPNRLLVEMATRCEPGHALDVCTGEGRNGVWLATQGWQVTGFDVSAEGLAAARRRAEAAGVSVTLLQQAVHEFNYEREPWDLIGVFYAPVPLADPAFVDRLTSTLAPGGLLVAESFASEADTPRRKPVDIDPAAVRHSFAAFDIVCLDDVVDQPDWTDRPQRLVRLVARKRSA